MIREVLSVLVCEREETGVIDCRSYFRSGDHHYHVGGCQISHPPSLGAREKGDVSHWFRAPIYVKLCSSL